MFDVQSCLLDVHLRVMFEMFEVRCVNVRGNEAFDVRYFIHENTDYKHKDWVKIIKVTFPEVTANTISNFLV